MTRSAKPMEVQLAQLKDRLHQERLTTKLQRQQLHDYEQQIQTYKQTIERLRELISTQLGQESLYEFDQGDTEDDWNSSQSVTSTPVQQSLPSLRRCPSTPSRPDITRSIRSKPYGNGYPSPTIPSCLDRQQSLESFTEIARRKKLSHAELKEILGDKVSYEWEDTEHNMDEDEEPLRPMKKPNVTSESPFVDVVRNKHERSKLTGSTCTCCAPFYQATGTLHGPEGNKSFTAEDRMQLHSRHRERYKRPTTPPGFWQLDFPSSMENYKE
ncbi:SURP and G-patch domain-containing protein 2 [Apophysomyces ossiformis]|uniref:SURP and G-patch domain-containing protein 2 n=1 Tax=Apophysomyces ossiformis TaxID=679940 RepID=A0A8H7ET54_9FUNG|nr:SURP and G-patch domain-containing protein 2 [Apophysomyces ossiformis]